MVYPIGIFLQIYRHFDLSPKASRKLEKGGSLSHDEGSVQKVKKEAEEALEYEKASVRSLIDA